jgi:enterochelin esterase-like enzyme
MTLFRKRSFKNQFAKICLTLAIPIGVSMTSMAQEQIPLWPNGAPGFEDRRDEPERAQDYWVRNVHNPSLTVFLPPKDKATGAAVVVCPGGGHRLLVFEAEGREPAEYLNSIGVAAFALKYRLGRDQDSPYSIEQHAREDGMRAMRLVRSRAEEWGVDPNRVGMLGFSAGGEVVSLVAYASGDGDPSAADPVDRLNAKPAFQMMVYPGPLGIPDVIPGDAPPALLVVANDDRGAAGTIAALFQKYRDAQLPVEAHVFARGGHAFNMGYGSRLTSLKNWPQRMADWMADNYLLDPSLREEEERRQRELAEVRRQRNEERKQRRHTERQQRLTQQTEVFDATGTWQWERTRRGSKTTYTLRLAIQEGELAGSYAMESEGAQTSEPLPIENVALEKNELSFSVTRLRNDREFTIQYAGTVSKAAITGFYEVNFGGDTRETEWEARRSIAPARRARREPTPNDTLISPELLSDNRVTFRIYAPDASKISLSGDWSSQGLGPGGQLERDNQGVWAITVGPLPPDFYGYSFNVDGVRIIDPKNPMIKPGVRGTTSMFLLPGETATFAENRSVPHGDIRQVWYQSATLGMQRRLHVYTPPGYDEHRDQQYPVLYLLHGGGDEDSGWSTIGRAGFVLDNLLAERKAVPMLIVMPNGSMPRPPQTAGSSPTSESEVAARREDARRRFTEELLNDVIPFAEAKFRVQSAPESRAIAGLSMGGGQTLRVAAGNFERFSYIAIWSSGLSRRSPEDFAAQNATFLGSANAINKQVKLLSISVGDQDFALEGSKSLSKLLDKRGIDHKFHISGGGHTWINWRRYLHDYAQVLFRTDS